MDGGLFSSVSVVRVEKEHLSFFKGRVTVLRPFLMAFLALLESTDAADLDLTDVPSEVVLGVETDGFDEVHLNFAISKRYELTYLI
jgi:hypothetical protein